MDNQQQLIQRKKELVALEQEIQNSSKPGGGGTNTGIVFTILGIILTPLAFFSGLFLGTVAGAALLFFGLILWIAGSVRNRKAKTI
jgi:uncharacterized membrane protein HdeD (DUF308 family)